MGGLGLAIAATAALVGVAAPGDAVDSPAFEKAYTESIGQLVTAPGRGGVNELNNRGNGTVGMRGTDLGVSFESEGRLYFLFGDSWVMGGGTQNDDSIAVTDARSVDRFQMPSLTWAAAADGSMMLRSAPECRCGAAGCSRRASAPRSAWTSYCRKSCRSWPPSPSSTRIRRSERQQTSRCSRRLYLRTLCNDRRRSGPRSPHCLHRGERCAAPPDTPHRSEDAR